jgi:phage-associated protein
VRYTPHDYQRQATDYIVTHPQAAIFLGMGLGKTVITLSAIWHLLMDSF